MPSVITESPEMTKPRIFYVGVGLMGLPMTKHLLSRGYTITAFDIAPDRLNAAKDAGAAVAGSAAEGVRGADFVVLNLPTTEAVEQAVFGDAGVASALLPPQILVDFSTIKVDKGRAFAA